jgi:hypothetical protein
MKGWTRAPLLLLLLFTLVSFDLGAATAYEVLIDEQKREPPLLRLVSFYQKHISVHDGAKCRFYPTCSEFYKIAIVRYGPFWSTIMVVDRLFYRESNWSMRFYPHSMEWDRYVDPVSYNFIFNHTDYYR